MVERSALKLGNNQPKVYRKTADNGRGRKQHFCPQCGSPLFTSGEGDDANEWGIRWGSINERDALIPKAQIWTRSAVGWVSDIERLPAYEKDYEE